MSSHSSPSDHVVSGRSPNEELLLKFLREEAERSEREVARLEAEFQRDVTVFVVLLVVAAVVAVAVWSIR